MSECYRTEVTFIQSVIASSIILTPFYFSVG